MSSWYCSARSCQVSCTNHGKVEALVISVHVHVPCVWSHLSIPLKKKHYSLQKLHIWTHLHCHAAFLPVITCDLSSDIPKTHHGVQWWFFGHLQTLNSSKFCSKFTCRLKIATNWADANILVDGNQKSPRKNQLKLVVYPTFFTGL